MLVIDLITLIISFSTHRYQKSGTCPPYPRGTDRRRHRVSSGRVLLVLYDSRNEYQGAIVRIVGAIDLLSCYRSGENRNFDHLGYRTSQGQRGISFLPYLSSSPPRIANSGHWQKLMPSKVKAICGIPFLDNSLDHCSDSNSCKLSNGNLQLSQISLAT